MKFGFIAKHRRIWPVAWMCDALGVSRAGFYAWLKRSPSAAAEATRSSAQGEGKLPCQRPDLRRPACLAATCCRRVSNAVCTGSSD